MLFRKKPKTHLDAPAAAEALRVEIATAIGRAEARRVSAPIIVNTLREAIGAQEYIAAVSARSSYMTTMTVERIGA